ncbi:hypothetical protein JW921_07010, partial [Candidatus Fermentibacterales bacterium]|nr:hypothetical protein [Candidatus Fermentibacterales bacterium]
SAFLFILLVGRGRKGLKGLLGIVLGALPPLAGMLLMNRYFFCFTQKTAYEMSRGNSLLGFGRGKAMYPIYGDYDHTLWRGIKNVAIQVGVGSVMVFGWPLLSFVPLLLSPFRARSDRRILPLFIPLVFMSMLLTLHSWPAIIYGPRHYYTFLPVVIALTIVGLSFLLGNMRRRWGERGGSTLLLTILGLYLISFTLYVPWQISQRSGPWTSIDRQPWLAAREGAEPPALVFIEGSDHGYPNLLSGYIYNTALLDDGDYIFCAHQTPDEDLEMMAAYPNRGPYLFWYDGERSHIEPWSEERAESLEPSRTVHPEPSPDLPPDQWPTARPDPP